MNNKIIFILIIGIILRIALAAFTFHPDIQHFDMAGWVIERTSFFNFYDYLSTLSGNDAISKVYQVNVFNYPPIVYLFLGSLSSFFAGFVDDSVRTAFLLNPKSIFGEFTTNMHLLTLKLPYLFFDLVSLFFFVKLFDSRDRKKLAFYFWLFNPINLYATYMIGQFDIIPTCFVIIVLWLVNRESEPDYKKLLLSSFILGIGALFKIYPFFLLIPLAALTNSWSLRVKIMLVGIIPYLLVIAPFMHSHWFKSTALVANQTTKSLYSQLPVSGGESILFFLTVLLFVYLVFLGQKVSANEFWKRCMITLSIFFIFTHYHPQWLLWLTPFLIYSLIRSKFKTTLPILIMFGSYVASLFFFDTGLTSSLFSPIFPDLFLGDSIWDFLNISVDYNYYRSVLHSIFVGALGYLIYYYYKYGD